MTKVESAHPDDVHVAVQRTAGRRRVVIVGGGFGGLQAARALRWADVDVVLVDRRNHHVFQPLLYQVATAGLSPGDIAAPIRWILRRQQNVQVLLGEAIRVDLAARTLHLDIGRLHYDALIIATGATHAYFGHDDWQVHAPGLKTLEDAGPHPAPSPACVRAGRANRRPGRARAAPHVRDRWRRTDGRRTRGSAG